MFYIISILLLSACLFGKFYCLTRIRKNILNYYLEKFPIFREADNVDDEILSNNIFVRKKR